MELSSAPILWILVEVVIPLRLRDVQEGIPMLVMVTENQLISPQAVCAGCLMADHNGQPRWQQGELRCGRLITGIGGDQPAQFECQMGFRIANIG